MPEPLFEILTGVIDGVNPTFFFSAAYAPGSVAIYLNGQLIFDDAGNPWSESDPVTGEITITSAKCIPKVGDKIVGWAIDTSPIQPETEVIELRATIEIADEFGSTIDVAETLSGTIETDPELEATIEAATDLTATIEEPDTLTATIEVC